MGFGASAFFYQSCAQTPARIALEAAAHAEYPKQHPAPVELRGYWQTQQWGLPYAGGWMEQPAGLLKRYRDAAWYFDAWRSWLQVEAGQMAEWKQKHPDWNRAANEIKELRKRLHAD